MVAVLVLRGAAAPPAPGRLPPRRLPCAPLRLDALHLLHAPEGKVLLGQRKRVVHPQPDTVLLLLPLRHQPGLVDAVRRAARQLRQPCAQVVAARIVVARLLHHVEAVQAAACEPRCRQPVAPVERGVIVHQPALKVVGAQAPVHTVLHDEEAGHVLPAAVGHVACGGQLAHAGVHQRHARGAVPPAAQQLRVGVPHDRDPLQPKLCKQRRAVPHRKEFVVVSRHELKDDPVCALICRPLRLVAAHLRGQPARGEAAERQRSG
mmetsp:Transcript_38848/g.97609  ORF Transcript_38848/g.97609 Transcript_38848/m.97609 type:complete len:263 (-) Transcript_38848:337-1125(-)